ncbi:MAG: sigma-70 family RNA polymerase sigma factor [Alphaproteobacteria bacterium]
MFPAALIPRGGLAALARRQPMLTSEEERALAARTREGDAAAAERLIASHLRCVVAQARRYARFDLPLTDLMQEGAMALTQAVQKFNPDAGVRLATYARAWIRSAMQDYAVRTWSLVRIGAGARQRRLFLALRRIAGELVDGADQLGERLSRDMIATLARQFEVPAREVVAIARRLAGPDTSLDRQAPDGSGEPSEPLIGRLADDRPTPEEHAIARNAHSVRRGALGEALAALTPRERLIITRRHLAEAAASFGAIGGELGLSKERVRVLEKKAMDKLRARLGPLFGQLSQA